jgi:regulator of CtrA degradation
VESGEIEWADAVDSDDLMVDIKICIQDDRDGCDIATPALLSLMERAHSLYMRAARMELQVAARHSSRD